MSSTKLICATVFLAIGAALCPTRMEGLEAAGASGKTTDAEARKEALSRLRKVVIGLHGHNDAHGAFPPAAIVARNGKPLLSWRVLILPFIEEKGLFEEFRLEEPWDSQHNKKLLAKMPKIYAPVRGKAEPGMTALQVFTGPSTPFKGMKGSRLGHDFPDGTSNTILVVEAAELVPWTKPADLACDAKRPLPKLGFSFRNVFLFATADGTAHLGQRDFDEPTMRLFIDPADGKPFDGSKVLANVD